MTTKLPPRDPEGAFVRRTIAARRTGRRQCGCGESRPEALIAGSKPMTCAACQRQQQGKTTEDQHHPAGVANHSFTIEVPVNDHRADLNTAQQDWPKETRENPCGSPLLRASASVRGYIDTLYSLIKRLLGWIPGMLEQLEVLLTNVFGSCWWERLGLAVPPQ